MKKYILWMFVLIATFTTSCTNDDITISYTTNFKVNPSTVIAPFTYELTTGELESFPSNYKLRIRLLVYGKDGLLVNEDVQYFTNYASVMSSSFYLPNGDYIALAVTDLVELNGNEPSFEFWTLSEHSKLAQTTITDAGYIGGQYKILGITKYDFSVSEGQSQDISINVRPVGALLVTYYANVWTYSDVETYGLAAAKTSESCTFDSQGNYVETAESNNGEYDWWMDRFDLADTDTQYSNIYNYVYTLPMTNLNLRFQANTATDIYYLSNPMTITPKSGEEYLFYIDLAKADSGYDVEYGLVNATEQRASLGYSAKSAAGLGNTSQSHVVVYLKDIK